MALKATSGHNFIKAHEGEFYKRVCSCRKRHLKFVWGVKDRETLSLQGKAVRGFSSLCLQDGCFLIASLSAFVGRKGDGEKSEGSSKHFIVLRQQVITEKSKSPLQTPARIENRIFPSKCKAVTGRLGEASRSKCEKSHYNFQSSDQSNKNLSSSPCDWSLTLVDVIICFIISMSIFY